MRLVNPRTGSVVDATDPVTIVHLRYGKGYWVLGEGGDPAAGPQPGVDQDPTLDFRDHPELFTG